MGSHITSTDLLNVCEASWERPYLSRVVDQLTTDSHRHANSQLMQQSSTAAQLTKHWHRDAFVHQLPS